jgi:hypothetical protein
MEPIWISFRNCDNMRKTLLQAMDGDAFAFLRDDGRGVGQANPKAIGCNEKPTNLFAESYFIDFPVVRARRTK